MLTPTVCAPPPLKDPWAPASDHLVQFYDRDEALVNAVSRYLRNGLESGAAAVMIATPEHRSALMAHWQGEGFDAGAWIDSGRLICRDAQETLQQIAVDDWPEAARFEAVVGQLVIQARARFGQVVAFGEMVALLWARDRRDAAVHLEQLWNALSSRHPIALFCAYPMGDCTRSEAQGDFRRVCDAHSQLMPAETFFEIGDERTQLRLIAELQQKAGALEREVEMRKRAQALLAERERELADFLENGVHAMHSVGADGTILWANQAELDLFGFAREDYVGRNIADFYVDPKQIADILCRLAAGETLREEAVRVRASDGSVRHVLVSSNARIEDGKVVSTRCFTRDVSDRWLAQEALRERAAVLHLAMQGSRMGYWVSDLERGTVRCGHELATLLGMSTPFEWDLESFLGLMHPEDRAGFRDALDTSISKRHGFAAEFRIRRATSDWRWFEARGEAVYDEQGAPRRFYGVCMDVTARKGEEQMLAHLAAVVDSAEDAIVSKTLDGIVTSWNRGASRIFGYEPEEMIGTPITRLIPQELHHEEAEIIARIRRGERVEHYQARRCAKDGSDRFVSLAISPIRDKLGRIVGASKIARLLPATPDSTSS
jgi:PAS domain S-box-containing protein